MLRKLAVAALCLIVSGTFGCGNAPSGTLGNLLDILTGGTGDSSTVGSVTLNPPSESPGQELPGAGAVKARIISQSEQAADVRVTFLRNDVIVHLAFLRVGPFQTTTVIGPETTDTLEVAGNYLDGQVIPQATFLYALDFDEGTDAVYILGSRTGFNLPPTLSIIAPAVNVDVFQEGQLAVSIDDSDPDDSAVITFVVQSLDTGDEFNLKPVVAEDPDGPADNFTLVLKDVPPGRYRFLGRISDGISTVEAVAAGMVTVLETDAAGNDTPQINLIEPSGDVQIVLGKTLAVHWDDVNLDNNAQIRVLLDTDDVLDNGETPLGPAIAEDPDGDGDQTTVTVAGIEPGVYFLRLSIDDGVNKSVSPQITTVTVLPNEAPELALSAPVDEIVVPLGGVFSIAWTDKDDDDQAVIRFFLGDAPIGPAVAEDPDGAGDRLTVLVEGLSPGTYSLRGLIEDAANPAVESTAPGTITVIESALNTAPTLTILQPAADVLIESTGNLFIQWQDEDADDNAAIVFFLDPFASEVEGDEIQIAAPFSEDADALRDDRALIPLTQAPVGIYRVLGVISDGKLTGTARSLGTVEVNAASPATAGFINLSLPAVDQHVLQGQSVLGRMELVGTLPQATVQFALIPELGGPEIGLVPTDGTLVSSIGALFTINTSTVPPGRYFLEGRLSPGDQNARALGKVVVSFNNPPVLDFVSLPDARFESEGALRLTVAFNVGSENPLAEVDRLRISIRDMEDEADGSVPLLIWADPDGGAMQGNQVLIGRFPVDSTYETPPQRPRVITVNSDNVLNRPQLSESVDYTIVGTAVDALRQETRFVAANVIVNFR